MKHLYKKIYEAINTGIQNALALDDEDDISMNYQYKKISNTINYIDIYVQEFLNRDNLEWSGTHYKYSKQSYLQILSIYESTGYMYKPKNYEEFRSIINALQDVKGINPAKINYKWIDMTDIVSCITNTGKEVPIQMADKNIKFLKFNFYPYYYNRVPNHPIIISTDLNINSLQWHKNVPIKFNSSKTRKYCKHYNPDAISINDYNGYENTYQNINIATNDFSNYPAFDFLSSKLSNSTFEAYMPSAGELLAIWENKVFILACLNMCRDEGEKIDKYFNGEKDNYYWTSTEYSQHEANVLKISGYTVYVIDKKRNAKLFPLFKEKGND
ncbi:MAG: hypothetical protein [Wendovervirus sonii]|uniref:Uncharacterized protein n=1 Tax=phage Lak_Megaphage_Sonny TaxID=3109229 RepID=A0ABZ0Z2T4_9CAUD|nr:MAG: hypothetical protein [phage Lak_Megaphage_Sonny]